MLATELYRVETWSLPLAVLWSLPLSYYLLGAGDAGAAGDSVAGACVAAGDACGVAVGCASGSPDCNTERCPVIPAEESNKAINMNAAAAPIVIFDSKLAVPRGPNAVLETLLENNAPASAFPGCSKTTTTKTTQDRMKRPYSM